MNYHTWLILSTLRKTLTYTHKMLLVLFIITIAVIIIIIIIMIIIIIIDVPQCSHLAWKLICRPGSAFPVLVPHLAGLVTILNKYMSVYLHLHILAVT